MIISGNIVDAWKCALKKVYEEGFDFVDDNGRICREIINLLIRVEDPSKDISKPIRILNDFGRWKYPSLDEIAQVMLSNKLAPDYAYSYGPRMFNFQRKIDQINDFIIPLLRENPNSRKAVVSLLDPVEDANILKSATPGLVMIDFKLREGRLNMTAIIRSNDLFFGWPANVYQLYVLQDFVRKKLDCKIGSLNILSISAHIFEDQFKYIKKVLD